MPAYYPAEMLEEMAIEATQAKERLAKWLGVQTYKNMRHLGCKKYTLEQCIQGYRNKLAEQELD